MNEDHSLSQLSQSLAWLQLVVDRLPQTIFWKDLNSSFLGCDQSFAHRAGLISPQEIIGKSDYDLPWTKEEADWYCECDRRVIKSNTPEYGILETLVDAAGKLTWLETNKIPLHDFDGNVIGILGTFEDVTARQEANQPDQYLEILEDISERKKAEAALEYQLQKTQLLNQITQAIRQSLDTQEIFHTATKQIRQFLKVERVGVFQLEGDIDQAARLNERKLVKFIGSDIITEDNSILRDLLQECFFDTYRAVDYQQGEVLGIVDIQTADLRDTHQAFLASLDIRAYLVVPLLQGNNLWGLLCLYQSSTPRQWQQTEIEFMQKIAAQLSIALYQAQLLEQEKQQRNLLNQQNQQLRQAKEDAEQANIAKSSFLAHMSHELRTPLNVILGFSQVMYRDATVTPQQKETLRIINQSGEHLLTLINDVLEITKIEAGKTSLNIDSFDLHHLLDSLAEMFNFKAQSQGVKLVFERSPDVPNYIQSDLGKVRQILINLLNNAIKFTSQGEVKLTTTAIAISSDLVNLSFRVSDTGVGIADTEIEQLFDPFSQTEAGTKSGQGTGLGLSIGRKFARMMGGDITVASQYESGSSFTFTLPTKSIAQATNHSLSTRRAIAITSDQPQYRILVVDDQAENRLLLTHLLTTIGFEVKEAVNGRESIEVWSTWNPDLILMDIQMPLMNGIDATRIIKTEAKAKPMPIIALSASAFSESQQQALQAGCDDFLSKPIKDIWLLEKIAQHLPVTYIYELTESSSIDTISDPHNLVLEDLSFMPSHWLARVKQAASQLNDQLLRELIAEIPQEHYGIKQALANKIANFDFDVILELIS